MAQRGVAGVNEAIAHHPQRRQLFDVLRDNGRNGRGTVKRGHRHDPIFVSLSSDERIHP
jgi:hypothetical protein